MTNNTTAISFYEMHDIANIGNAGVMLANYPDVMDINQVSEVVGVSTKTAYSLLQNGKIAYLKIGRSYRIPKVKLQDYLFSAQTNKTN